MAIKKGTMIWPKKILGTIVGIAGIGIVLGINAINTIVADYELVFGGILIFLAYLLVISGRQL